MATPKITNNEDGPSTLMDLASRLGTSFRAGADSGAEYATGPFRSAADNVRDLTTGVEGAARRGGSALGNVLNFGGQLGQSFLGNESQMVDVSSPPVKPMNPAGDYVNTVLDAFGQTGSQAAVEQSPDLGASAQLYSSADISQPVQQPEAFDPLASQQQMLDLQSANLADLFAGIASDSQAAFGRLQGVAGDRGEATLGSLQQVNADIAARLGQVGSDVAQGAADSGFSGGFAQSTLEQGASAGAAPVANAQATLGGFLEGSQVRRTNAIQNFLTGLEGQSQNAMDRARTAGEFALAQQQALIDRERAMQENDIAAQAASNAVLESLVGPAAAVWDQLPSDVQTRIFEQQNLGGGEGQMQPRTPGAFGEIFASGGIPEPAVQGFEELELELRDELNQIASGPVEEQQGIIDQDGLTAEGLETLLGRNIIVTSDQDPRLYQRVDIGGGRGSRFFITQDDYNKYLQLAETGALN